MTLSDSPSTRHSLRTRAHAHAHRTGFHDNDLKSQAWQDIAHSNVKAVTTAIDEDPCYAKMRAADGRGPLFWAHEFYNQKIIDALASTSTRRVAASAVTRITPPSRVVRALIQLIRTAQLRRYSKHAAWSTRWWSWHWW